MTRTLRTASALALMALSTTPALAADSRIDLTNEQGASKAKAEWRWHDVKIVEAENQSEGKTLRTYDYEPKAHAADYNDSSWEIIAPSSLGQRRSGGKVCFCWYRLKVTLPDDFSGKSAEFVATVDDYGEVWVDGKLPYTEGDSGGPIVAGFNAPNRVTLPNPEPGKTYSIAIFGINGPISKSPTNRIFLRNAYLDIHD